MLRDVEKFLSVVVGSSNENFLWISAMFSSATFVWGQGRVKQGASDRSATTVDQEAAQSCEKAR